MRLPHGGVSHEDYLRWGPTHESKRDKLQGATNGTRGGPRAASGRRRKAEDGQERDTEVKGRRRGGGREEEEQQLQQSRRTSGDRGGGGTIQTMLILQPGELLRQPQGPVEGKEKTGGGGEVRRGKMRTRTKDRDRSSRRR